MSMSSGKKNKKYEQKLIILEREKEYLQTQYNTEGSRLAKAKEELQSLRDAKDQIRQLEREHAKLQKKHAYAVQGIALIRKKVSNKRYFNNVLAKDIVVLLEEHCPTEEQRMEKDGQKTKSAFKRIKDGIEP